MWARHYPKQTPCDILKRALRRNVVAIRLVYVTLWSFRLASFKLQQSFPSMYNLPNIGHIEILLLSYIYPIAKHLFYVTDYYLL